MAAPRTALTSAAVCSRPPASTSETLHSLREYAIQQAIRAARELALLHTDRNRRIVDGVARHICDRCRAVLTAFDDSTHHEQGCPVGRALHFIHELSLLTPGLVTLETAVCRAYPDAHLGAVEQDAFAGDHVEPCFLPGVVCGAPDCSCDSVTRCMAAAGCNFPSCNCSEENRCVSSYPVAAEGGVA